MSAAVYYYIGRLVSPYLQLVGRHDAWAAPVLKLAVRAESDQKAQHVLAQDRLGTTQGVECQQPTRLCLHTMQGVDMSATDSPLRAKAASHWHRPKLAAPTVG